MYDFIQPMLFILNKAKIIEKKESLLWEEMVALKITQIAIQNYQKTDEKRDTLYVAIFPEFTFQKEKNLAFSRDQVQRVQKIISEGICRFSNLLVIAGTIVWQDNINHRIYNSALIFYQDKCFVWDKLFIHGNDYANPMDMGRWVPADIENYEENIVYYPNGEVFDIKYVEEDKNIIVYSYTTPGTDGIRVTDCSPKKDIWGKEKKGLYHEILRRCVLSYTISEGLMGSSLGQRVPMFSLHDSNLPVIALDICRDHYIGVAKAYCDNMQRNGVNSIAVYILIADEMAFIREHVPQSAAISIICDAHGRLSCVDYRNLEELNFKEIEDTMLEKGKIYNAIPLQIE